MASWFVFTERELAKIESPSAPSWPELGERLRERGHWTDDGTLLVKPRGPDAFALTAMFDKYPRRIGPDPPVDVSPLPTE